MFYKWREARSASCRHELDQSPSATLGSAMVDSPPRARALSTVLGSAAVRAPPGPASELELDSELLAPALVLLVLVVGDGKLADLLRRRWFQLW
jgi:hypothetical protein